MPGLPLRSVIKVDFQSRKMTMTYWTAQTKAEPDAAYLTAVPIISDVGARALPSNTILFSGPLRVQEWSHALRVQAAALHQVDDSEAVSHSSLHVPHSEVKPLCVLHGVQVRTQSELIVIDTPDQARHTSRQKIYCEQQ